MSSQNDQNKSGKNKEKLLKSLSEGTQAYHDGRLDKAHEIYTQILKDDPTQADALHALGFIAIQENNLPAALELYEKAVAAYPDSAEFHGHLAKVLSALQNYESAEKEFKKAIQLKPDEAEHYHNLGTLYYKTQRRSEALQLFFKAVQLQPEYVDAHYSLALLFLADKNNDAALKELNNVVNLYPGHLPAQYQLGTLLLQQNEFSLAKEHYFEVLKFRPEHIEVLNNVGVILLHENNLTDALQYFYRVVALEPNHIEARNNMAAVLMKMNHFDEALENYKILVNLQPDDIEAHYNLGVALFEMGQYEASNEQNKWIITKDSNYVAAYINLGAAYIKQGNIPEALSYYQKAQLLQPQNPSVAYMIAAISGNQQPRQAPEAYIKDLFDHYAHYYDLHLTETLQYDLPATIRSILTTKINLSAHRWKLLDLGCGTGLVGKTFHEIADQLVGIDLSSKMLDIAREKQIYDQLLEGDLIAVLSQMTAKFDLIIAADTVVYFGDLQQLLLSCKNVLYPSGYLVISTELLPNTQKDFQLEMTGRYSHNPHYIYKVAESLGLAIISQQEVILRTEKHVPCKGLVTILQK